MNITRGYKVSTDDKKDDIDKRTGMLAQKLKIEIKMEQHTSTPASVTLRDHKNKFSTNKHCRLINQAKSKLGIVSKIILEKLIKQIRAECRLRTQPLEKLIQDVLYWFKDLQPSPKPRFLKFDV